jgi:hypothetical protein
MGNDDVVDYVMVADANAARLQPGFSTWCGATATLVAKLVETGRLNHFG